MKKRILTILFILLVSTILPARIAAQQATVVTGIVTDSLTKEPLSFVSVYLKGTQSGTNTDLDGKFTLRSTSKASYVVFSTLGYIEQTVKIIPGQTNTLNIAMSPAVYEQKEVVVRPGKEKYKKKGNPAVEFVKKVIDHKDDNDPKKKEYFSYEEYEKMTIALNDFSEEQKKKWIFKKFQFIFDYVDTSEVSGKPILTVSIKEKIADNYYRKDPNTQKKLVTGIKRAGIDEMFNQESLQQFYDEVFKEINIFDNDINLMLNRFVSPLSHIATSFYKFYLLDTLDVGGERCVDLGFVPFNSESFGFTGHMYVTLDSTYFIKEIKLNVPKDINLNYVENMTISQDFIRTKDGTRLKTKDDIIVEFRIMPHTQGLYARRLTTYDKFSFAPPPDMSIFSKEGNIIIEDDAEIKPEAYWADNRHVPVNNKENAVDKLLVKLRSVPVFYYLEKVIKILVSGYIETGPDSKFDFGPMNTTISGNSVEGARFRVGGLTTANLNPHLFARGYVAYGTKDKKFKYSGELEYSFNEKKYHAREFPIHSIKVSHSYDINELGQHYLYTNKDNIFMSLKRMRDTSVVYQRNTEVSYLREHLTGFSYGLNLRYKTQYATPWVPFIQGNGIRLKDYSMAEAEIKLRYAPNEKYYQTKSNRFPISRDAPVFTLSHTVGIKGILKSRYNMNFTELGIQKRFWFSAFGYTDVIVKAGKVWDKVPYPLLIIPNANLSYTIREESYALMNPMEFLNDEFVSWDITYFANGALLNRIPLIKYLKWREVIAFRGLYGNLTKKNNPLYDNKLFVFPKSTHLMDKMPYMEASAGLDNIFTILRIEYVWRLTYRNLPHIDKGGVRIALHFTF
ncbi:DUF5686 and carboxypeptidase-like regulatory domain-containing protein [Coprobacter tertius]|uniref:DUF5686 and carboxypeptidase regulatory-like domain-containing protein n=1 Tax=Coprobacter tertius TaxID=2944915 RepID=A0ABT1MJ54_9BACT|nr:DUF5686 and carboxypeptidase-like regulatory domain-containing protein [Coprobacter tertius]MCP9612642.1 DUF5686 and carboxypeptidase regulatory-like domain-containing protein [Coprobacter tertius]